jgi:hypothetical protein
MKEDAMRKVPMLITVAGLVLAGPLFMVSAGAQNAVERQDRAAITANQMADEADADIARIKARLRLTPDQEKNWSGLETTLRDLAKKRAERWIARRTEREQHKDDPGDLIEHWRRRSDVLSQRSVNLKSLADAAQPLYASLDEGQKERFYELVGRWLDLR